MTAMRRDVLTLCVAFLIVTTCACHGGSTPAAPTGTAPPPTVDALAITSGVSTLRSGFFADFTLTATLSDRTTQIVRGEWRTSDSSVATVDANGRLTAVTHGSVALTAAYQGRTANRNVRIIYDYGGHWDGTFVARTCDQTGIFLASHYCQNLGADTPRFALELTQTGENLDEIGGMMSLRGLIGAVSGSVTSDDRLILNASYVAVSDGLTLQVGVPTWLTAPSGGAVMTGSFVETLGAMSGASGRSTQTNDIVTATRKASGALRAR